MKEVQKTSFDIVVSKLRPFRIQDAIATNESDQRKINTIIEKHLGCRIDIEEICCELGLDVFTDSKDAVFDTGSRADGGGSYVYNSAEGVIDGERVRWDHVERKVINVENGEVMFDMNEGLVKMNRMVNDMVKGFYQSVRRFMVRRTSTQRQEPISTDLVFVMRNAIVPTKSIKALYLDTKASLPVSEVTKSPTSAIQRGRVRKIMSELI